MKLAEVIDDHYSGQQKTDVILLLEKYGFYGKLEGSLRRYQRYTGNNKTSEHLSNFKPFICELIDLTLRCKDGLRRKTVSEAAFNAVLNIVAFIISDRITAQNIKTNEFSVILKDATSSCYHNSNDESWIFHTFISCVMRNVPAFAGDPAKNTTANEDNPSFSIRWEEWPDDKRNKLTTTSFSLDLTKALEGIQNEKAIAGLFDEKHNGKKIAIPLAHLCAFLCLFSLLHQCKRITCSPRRGLFYYLRSRIKALPNETLPTRKDYRKLKSEALADPRHNTVIMQKIKELFDKYCPGKENKKLFRICFSTK